MEISKEEKQKIKNAEMIFMLKKLSREQMNLILSRSISDKEWKQYNLPQSNVVKNQTKRTKVKPTFNFKDVAKHAAKKGKRRMLRQNTRDDYRIAKLFKTTNSSYNIVKVREYHYAKYNSVRSEWKISGDVDIYQTYNAITELVNEMTRNQPDNAKLQIAIENTQNNIVNETQLLQRRDMINKLDEWVSWFLDYKDMDIGDVTFKLLAIQIPEGSGKVNQIITLDSKRSIIKVNNSDTLCLARSIVVSLSKHNENKFVEIFKNNLTADELKSINKGRQAKNHTCLNDGTITDLEKKYLVQGEPKKLQGILAKALHRICNIPISKNGCGLDVVKMFEEALNIEIQVYNLEARQIYKGIEKETKIYILISDNHYNVITNIGAFTCANYSSSNKSRDRKCKACGNKTKCDMTIYERCEICNKSFYSRTCYDNHTLNGRCLQHSYKCEQCNRIYKTKELKREEHRCDEYKCANCKLYVKIDHKCFIKRREIKPISEKYIFFDFECKKDSTTNKHIVNYGAAIHFEGQSTVFKNVEEFCTWAFDKNKHRGYTFIAHYGKGYDFQFIAEWLIAHGVRPDVIQSGQKIMQLEVKREYNIRFIDSLSFTLMPLRGFPKTFGLTELAKGYFPHHFNTDENQNYVGKYPAKQYYGYEQMKKAEKIVFDDWYETVKYEIFDFKEEMSKYCYSDVDILRKGCLKLRELFIEIAGIDPFQYITIAGVCMAIYQSEFLQADTIGVCDEAVYDTYSIKSIKWLKYIAGKNQIQIRHACNGGEQEFRINGKNLKVDGYCRENNTVFQFHGCYYHGCLKCYAPLTVNNVNKYNMKFLSERTRKIEEIIKGAGYTLVTIWEHEFDKNNEMKNTPLNEFDLVEPPNIRDGAFHGGRTEPFKLIYDFENKKTKGKYIDVVSLYPTVMFYDKFPVNHPTKIVKPNYYDKKWFGFVYCKVLPPRGLYLPVLPCKQTTKNAQKLLFGLCKSCMQRIDDKCVHFKTTKNSIKCVERCTVKGCLECKIARKRVKENCKECFKTRNSDCNHADVERMITGFWTTIELEKAIEKGYHIVDIYEVWHFEQTSTELFKGYIKKFMKIKFETSAFTCSEEEYRMKARKFGIELGELKENPGLRFIAKICLNSLWGKFGQNPRLRHTEYIDNEKDFYNVVLNDKISAISLSFLNDTMVYASYQMKGEFLKHSYNTNIYIACFTASHARARLYNMMEKLDRKTCYCDTDSVVYIEDDSAQEIVKTHIGDGLGEWTDELGGKYMTYWCCAQAKDYGYSLNNNEAVGKVKGFRCNAETEEKMTNDQRRLLIMGAVDHININYNQFTIRNCEITTRHMMKQWAFKFDKRMIRVISDDEIDTLPYGY